MATASPVNAMATASPEPLGSGEAVDENVEEGVSDELRQLPDRVLQERLQRLDRGIAVRLPDGGKKYRDHHRTLSNELARRQAATCSAPPSPSPHPPHRRQAEPEPSSHPPHRRQGEPDDDRCERLDQSRCAESSDIQATSSLPAQLPMEAPVCPSKQLPDVHVVKPKLEACEDSLAPASGAAEDWETTPLSGSHPFFTTVMSRTQVQKPFQLCIPGRFHHRLPEARTAAVLLCRGKSWAMCYCGDLKLKKLDAEWTGFAVDNQLRVGDACVFELVTDTGGEEEEVVFQVQILRGGLPEAIITKGATADEPIVIVD